jgi:hypothetical protein
MEMGKSGRSVKKAKTSFFKNDPIFIITRLGLRIK